MFGVLHKLALWYLISIPIVAGISIIHYQVDGFNFTGYIWVAQLVVGLILLGVVALLRGHQPSAAPWYPWLAFYGWVWLSLLWSDNVGRWNLQIAAQFSMPVVVGMLAAQTIRTRRELHMLLSAFIVPLLFIALFVMAFHQDIAEDGWAATTIRAGATTATLIGCVFLAGIPRRVLVPILGWGACLLITAATSSRIATFSLLGLVIIHPLYRNKLWNLAAIIPGLVLAVALFYTPTFQAHFFESGQGSIDQLLSGNFKDYGRFTVWNSVWNQACRHPVLGGGVGSSFDFVPGLFDEGEEKFIHNDYLRMFFEFGAVGMVLFATAVVWQLISLYRATQSSGGELRSTFAAAWMGLVAMLISCYTDNTITHHLFYMNPMFALIGAAYGVASSERQMFSTLRHESAAPLYGYGGATPLVTYVGQ